MSVNSTIARAKGVAEDGRLHNVRTRHIHLTSLFKAIQSSHASLLDATLVSFPKLTSTSIKLALSRVLNDIQSHASSLDENKMNKHYAGLSIVSTPSIHHSTIPIGTVLIAAYSIQYNPIAAIFGPLASAIAAGCPCIIFAEDSIYSSRLQELISTSLDKEAYSVVIDSDASFKSVYSSFDKVVTYQQTTLPNALHVNGQKKNLVVVDQSLVDESVYRVKGKKPSQRELRYLSDAAQVIGEAMHIADVSAILVSENVAPFFSKLLQSNTSTSSLWAKSSSNLIVSCRSTEHIISELEKRQVESNGLFIFASPKQATYYSRYTNHNRCAINCMPIELLTGYVPTRSLSATTLLKKQQASLSLEPLWSTDLFTLQSSTVINPLNKIVSSSSTRAAETEQALEHQLSAQPPFMLRRKGKALEFFPTGFVITAFPTLLTVLGLTGYTTFKTGLFVYRRLQPFVREWLRS